MVRNRKGLAPWSLAREAGIESATVDGTIEVPQYVQPTLNTGFVDEKGDWKGAKSSDKDFIGLSIDEAIANGGTFIFPSVTDRDFINMTGYQDLIIALKATRSGVCGFKAIMGPATRSYANLSPVNAGSTLKFAGTGSTEQTGFNSVIEDSSEAVVANYWVMFMIQRRAKDQKNMQMQITNNTGDAATFETAYMRLI